MRPRFRYYLFFAIVLVVSLSVLIPNHYNLPYPKPPGPLLDEDVHKGAQQIINQSKPAIILLGDSVLDSGVDAQSLSALTGQGVYKLAIHGSTSAIWYLSIKNNIVTARHKPAYVVILFRGSMLTTPEYRTTGTYQVLIDELSTPDDHLLIELAYVNQMTWLERTLDQYFPLYAHRQLVRNSIEEKIKYPLSERLTGYEEAAVDEAINIVFGDPDIALLNAIINNVDSYLYHPDKLDFEAQLPRSFLPEIVRLCQENDIQLVLVRTKVEQYPTPETQPEGMNEYLQSLTAYAEQNSVIFFDLGFDPRIAPEYFSDAIHLTGDGQHILTEILAEKMNSLNP